MTRRPHGILNGMLSIVLDPTRLVFPRLHRGEIDALVAYVKSASPLDPNCPVLVAAANPSGSPARPHAPMASRSTQPPGTRSATRREAAGGDPSRTAVETEERPAENAAVALSEETDDAAVRIKAFGET